MTVWLETNNSNRNNYGLNNKVIENFISKLSFKHSDFSGETKEQKHQSVMFH